MRRWLLIPLLITAACAPTAGSSEPEPAAMAPATFEDFAARACDAFEALFAAVGNPDTGVPSALSAQLDQAVERGDRSQADRAAEAIIAELERGQAVAAAAGGWPPGAVAMSELNDVLVAYEAYVRAKQELAAGNPADPQAVFEAAGGVTSWQAMLEAATAVIEARPSIPQVECDGIPMSW